MPSKDEVYKDWTHRIAYAEARLALQQPIWEDTLRTYRGLLYPEDQLLRRKEGVNRTLSLLSRLLPRLYYREPDVRCRPKVPDPVAIGGAEALSAVLSQEFRHLKQGVQSRRSLVDALLYNVGWNKTGYKRPFQNRAELGERVGALPPGFSPEDGAARPSVRNKLLKHFKLKETDVSTDPTMLGGSLFSKRVNPKFMLQDPDATTYEDVTWVAHIIPRRIEALEESDFYDSSVVGKISQEELRGFLFDPSTHTGVAAGVDNHPLGGSNARIEKQVLEAYSRGWVDLFEIWDKNSGMVFVMVRGGDGWIRKPREWPYDMQDFPFQFLQFNDDPEDFYGEAPAASWIPLIQELEEYRKKRRIRIKKNVSKWAIRSELASPVVASVLRSDVEGDVAKVDIDEEHSINNFIKRIDPAGTPPDVLAAEAQAENELGNISGVTRERRGEAGPYVTATAASLVEVATQDLEGDRLRTLSIFQQDVATALLNLSRQYKRIPDFVRVAGAKGFNVYQVNPALLTYPWDVEVVIGSSRFIPEDQLINNLVSFFQLGGSSGFIDPFPLLRALGERLGIGNVVDLESVLLDPANKDQSTRLANLSAARQIMGIIMDTAGALGGQNANGTGDALQAVTRGGIAGGAQNTFSPAELASSGGRTGVPLQ